MGHALHLYPYLCLCRLKYDCNEVAWTDGEESYGRIEREVAVVVAMGITCKKRPNDFVIAVAQKSRCAED